MTHFKHTPRADFSSFRPLACILAVFAMFLFWFVVILFFADGAADALDATRPYGLWRTE